jgi:hypothetical protein
MLDVPRELVRFVAGLLRAERRQRGTRRGGRALTCWYQALMVLVWYRKHENLRLLAAGFKISQATAYRYRDEVIAVLQAQRPDLYEALHRVADEGWTHVIIDGKLFRTDRCAETTTSVKGKTINAWYSGKHHDFGGNIQAIFRPDGLPIWLSEVAPGHDHDLTVARTQKIITALVWAAASLKLSTLADSGYDGAGQGIHTPIKTPPGGHMAPDNETYNLLQRGLRALGERGFALLTGRWTALTHITASPRKISDITAAALILTHFEHGYLNKTPC